jgi:hypothetical protein
MVDLQKLLFAPPFPNILFTGEKNKTFRVTGGERYKIGEQVAFCYVSGEEFARARIIDKLRRTFETLTESDWQGHERFASEQEMYQTYSTWQRFQVGPKTELDILVYDNFYMTGRLPAELSQPKCTDLSAIAQTCLILTYLQKCGDNLPQPQIRTTAGQTTIKYPDYLALAKAYFEQNQSKCIKNPFIIKEWDKLKGSDKK